VHGVEIMLPKGYVGIVWRGDASDGAHPHPPTGSKARRRFERNSGRKPTEEEMDEVSPEDKDQRPVRVLKPTVRFDSLVLWHPDILVDEGKGRMSSFSLRVDEHPIRGADVPVNVKCVSRWA